MGWSIPSRTGSTRWDRAPIAEISPPQSASGPWASTAPECCPLYRVSKQRFQLLAERVDSVAAAALFGAGSNVAVAEWVRLQHVDCLLVFGLACTPD